MNQYNDDGGFDMARLEYNSGITVKTRSQIATPSRAGITYAMVWLIWTKLTTVRQRQRSDKTTHAKVQESSVTSIIAASARIWPSPVQKCTELSAFQREVRSIRNLYIPPGPLLHKSGQSIGRGQASGRAVTYGVLTHGRGRGWNEKKCWQETTVVTLPVRDVPFDDCGRFG